MKKFIYKILFFIIIYLLISGVITFFIPYHWGNPWYSSKIRFLEKKSGTPYNTFFFGSSRVYRQIDPLIFDGICDSLSSETINSFNLGAAATFCPQTYFLYDQFLNSELSANARFCIIELLEVDKIDDFFLHQERTSYWQNLKDLRFAGKSILNDPEISTGVKLKSISSYWVSYTEKIFHLGHFGQELMNDNFYDEKYIGPDLNGFFPLDADLATTSDHVVKKHLLERRKKLEADTSAVRKRMKIAMQCHKNISDRYDVINKERILEMINVSKERGITLIFLLSPRNITQRLVNLSAALPQKNVIDMSDPGKYPELYSLQYSFDVGHLNEEGAKKYSGFLAREFVRLIK